MTVETLNEISDSQISGVKPESTNGELNKPNENDLRFEFLGSTQEYFKIWIVNLSLNLLTIGIYSPWAKVRKKRYFYSHTALDGTSFQYLGQPIPILYGRLVAVALFLAYYLSSHLFKTILPFVVIPGLALAPWILIRSAAFNTRYSAYRNITFNFSTSYGAAAKAVYSWAVVPIFVTLISLNAWERPILIAVLAGTCALFYPLWNRSIRTFLVCNSSYGGKNAKFASSRREFYGVYIVAAVFPIIVTAGYGVLVAIMMFHHFFEPALIKWMGIIASYSGYGLAYACIQTKVTNLVWNNTTLGPLKFRSNLPVKGMVNLYFTNVLAIVASAGLLIPWAVMRTAKFRVSHMKVIATGDIAEFQGSKSESVQATGAETMELFNMDFSL